MVAWNMSKSMRAKKGTPFYCHVVEALRIYADLCALRDADGSETEVELLRNGDILIRHSGDQSTVEMPNWPYYSGGAFHTITGGRCPGAPLQ